MGFVLEQDPVSFIVIWLSLFFVAAFCGCSRESKRYPQWWRCTRGRAPNTSTTTPAGRGSTPSSPTPIPRWCAAPTTPATIPGWPAASTTTSRDGYSTSPATTRYGWTAPASSTPWYGRPAPASDDGLAAWPRTHVPLQPGCPAATRHEAQEEIQPGHTDETRQLDKGRNNKGMPTPLNGTGTAP